MSGSNPFRPKNPVSNSVTSPQQHQQPRSANKTTIAGAPASALIDAPSHTPSPRPKIVRIASPPVDARLSRYSSSEIEDPDDIPSSFQNVKTRPGSPPPATPREDEDSDSDDDEVEDPFNPDGSGSEIEEGRKEGRRIEGRTHTGVPDQGRIRRGEHRTDEPITTFPGLQRSLSLGPDEPESKNGMLPKRKRATMDVDAFKRLLMTGDAGDGAGSTAPVQAASQSQAGSAGYGSSNNNNANAGSLSRQTTFDSQPTMAEATPRASHEPSTSGPDKERKKTMRQSTNQEKKKPPPPKTRHGKLIKEAAGPASPLNSSMPLHSSSSPSTSTSTSSPSSTHEAVSGAAHTETHTDTTAPSSTNSRHPPQPQPETHHHPSPTTQPKRAPTPPLARRHSQMKPNKSGLSRTNSAHLSLPPSTTSLNSASSPLRTPPPPPSRRAGATTDPHHFSMSDVPSRLRSPLPSSDGGSESSVPTPDLSSRKPSDNTNNNNRADSASITSTSNSSAKLSRTPSTRSATAPRPPPPRRAGAGAASRASMDEVRPANVLGGKSANADVDAERTPSNARGILDDLSRLQREVDELRGQYGRRGSEQ